MIWYKGGYMMRNTPLLPSTSKIQIHNLNTSRVRGTMRELMDKVSRKFVNKTTHIKGLQLRKSLPQMLLASIVIRSESGAPIITPKF